MTDLRTLWTDGPQPAKPEPPPTEPKKAPKKKAKRKKPKAKKVSEELDVICRAAGEHRDLVGVPGFLVIDLDAEGRPSGILFDPIDDAIPNAELPVSGVLRSDKHIAVTDAEEGTRWRFELTDHGDLDPELEVDWDADMDIDDEHPFNRGLR